MFGADLSIRQYDKDRHSTYLGVFITIMVYPFLIFLTYQRLNDFDLSSQDKIFQSTEIYANSNPPPAVNLNESDRLKLDFTLLVNNPNFDNDDNPYGRFIMH